jgi:hypothetical protein
MKMKAIDETFNEPFNKRRHGKRAEKNQTPQDNKGT